MGYFYTLNPIAFHHDTVSTEIPFELRYEISDKEHTLLIAATMVGKELYETPNHGISTRDCAKPAVTIVQALDKLATYRYNMESKGVFFKPVAATVPLLFASDRESRGIITAIILINTIVPLTDINPWKVGGDFVNLTKNEIITIGLKIGAYVAACFATEDVKQELVRANPTVDITTGWPANT